MNTEADLSPGPGPTPAPPAPAGTRRAPRSRASCRLRGWAARATSAVATLVVAGLTGGLVVDRASAHDAQESPCAAPVRHAEPGSLFESVEAAAIAALRHARHTTQASERGRFAAGTVRRVAGGYTYTATRHSSATIWQNRRAELRYALGREDVATYLVHPRSGNDRIDRHNETPNRSERRAVDQLDPMGRPLFVLTPSLRVVRYANRELREVAVLDEPPAPDLAAR